MNKKLVLTIAFTILLTAVGFSQKIKLKKGKVLVDGKAIMKYERESWGVYKVNLFSLETDDELIELNKNDNEAKAYYDDDFLQIRFLTLGKIAEVKTKKSFKKIIGWLLKKKVITANGEINEEKIDLFIKNYDENITNRTVR